MSFKITTTATYCSSFWLLQQIQREKNIQVQKKYPKEFAKGQSPKLHGPNSPPHPELLLSIRVPFVTIRLPRGHSQRCRNVTTTSRHGSWPNRHFHLHVDLEVPSSSSHPGRKLAVWYLGEGTNCLKTSIGFPWIGCRWYRNVQNPRRNLDKSIPQKDMQLLWNLKMIRAPGYVNIYFQ